MKSTAFALGLSLTLAATTAHAGSLNESVVVPDVMVAEEASASSGDYVPILLLGLLLAAALTNSGGNINASDARLKTDIAPTGERANGLPLYTYRYIGLPTVYEGVMAQDVLTHHPDAIVPLPFGLMAVDYDKLGLEMRILN